MTTATLPNDTAAEAATEVHSVALKSAMIRTIQRSEARVIREVCEVRTPPDEWSHIVASQLLDGVQVTLNLEPYQQTDSGALSLVLSAEEADNLARILDFLVANIRGQEVGPLK